MENTMTNEQQIPLAPPVQKPVKTAPIINKPVDPIDLKHSNALDQLVTTVSDKTSAAADYVTSKANNTVTAAKDHPYDAGAILIVILAGLFLAARSIFA